jgi:hypothetical protein
MPLWLRSVNSRAGRSAGQEFILIAKRFLSFVGHSRGLSPFSDPANAATITKSRNPHVDYCQMAGVAQVLADRAGRQGDYAFVPPRRPGRRAGAGHHFSCNRIGTSRE